ncbi:MAG: hypothetical protein IT208_05470 [Chthonomonadales bacterium]|nr:hypothetical protein [Chthonomonadales bacterium]
MRLHRRCLAGIALLALAPGGSARATDLAAGFRNPPASARPHTWWHWVNGNVSRAGITADLEAMRRAGIGGAQIFHVDCGLPAGKVGYMSPEWRDLMAHAVREAARLGIEICVHNCAGWSSSGGPWITPEHAMQILVWTERRATGPGRLPEPLARPQARLGFYRDIAVLAYPTPPSPVPGRAQAVRAKAAFDRADRLEPEVSPTPPGSAVPREEVLDLTARMDAEGRLDWEAPPGDWTILRMGYTPTGKDNHPAPPEGRGLECDKLSREALDAHWDGMMAKVIADVGPLAGKVLNNALIDSYEVGSQNWTPRLRQEFVRRRGYDPLPFLPAVTGALVGSLETTERFLWDFRRTIADLYADNYFGYFGERCHAKGMLFSTEPYGNGPFDNLQSGGTADIPMGEFWVGGGASETAKLAASAAHIHGRRIVGAESFTADDQRGRWLVEPYGIKALGDMIFCNGVNRYIFHRYAHQPWQGLVPGMTMGPWGTHLERTITWWNQASAWLRYVARCQYLLQSGRFAADVCYFAGEGAPNDMPDRGGPNSALPAGYDFDAADTRTLLSATVTRDGALALPAGMRYRVLVLPDSPFMTPTLARKVRDLARAGATVVGPAPRQSPSLSGYPRCDEEVRAIAAEVWGDLDGAARRERTFGKGRVVWGVPLATVLARAVGGPDFAYPAAPGRRLAYIHRIAGDTDLYFVSNQRYRSDVVECSFRAGDRLPELWRPDTGAIEPAPIYRLETGRARVRLRLDPAGSVFVVFRRPAPRDDHLVAVERVGAPSAAAGPRIEIEHAYYEPADGRPGGADVTARVTALVAAGQTEIEATNAMFGDPTPLVVKRLRVEYRLDGKSATRVVGENETLELAGRRDDRAAPAYEVLASARGALLVPWEGGAYTARTASGRSRGVTAPAPRTVPVLGPWTLRFPPGLGAPASARLAALASWTDNADPGIRYFSGTATYTTDLEVPAAAVAPGRRLALDLGRVLNFAEVTLNGRSLGVLWKAPFRVDVTGIARPGANRLQVRVTNLWPNRLIGDEQLPPEVQWNGPAIARWPDWLVEGKPRPKTDRITFTTWRFYTKDSPLLESGLIGPVTLYSALPVALMPAAGARSGR